MDLPAETLRRVDELCAAFRAEVLRLLAASPVRPLDVKAVAVVERHQLRKDSRIEVPPHYPIDLP